MGREPQRPAIPRAEWLLIDLILTYGLLIVVLRTEKWVDIFFRCKKSLRNGKSTEIVKKVSGRDLWSVSAGSKGPPLTRSCRL